MKDPFLKSEFLQRPERFQHLLEQNEIDGAVIVQKADLYYLVGSDQNGLLWVPAEGQPLFLVHKGYERAKDAVAGRVVALTKLSQSSQEIARNGRRSPSRIGLEEDSWDIPFLFPL